MTFGIYIRGQLCGYLKTSFSFLTRLQYMEQNSFFLNEIDREATEMRTGTHLQDSLPGKGIPLKTTQAFSKIFKEIIYSPISQPIFESSYFQCLKFSKFFVCFVMLLIAPALFDLIIAHHIKKQA